MSEVAWSYLIQVYNFSLRASTRVRCTTPPHSSMNSRHNCLPTAAVDIVWTYDNLDISSGQIYVKLQTQFVNRLTRPLPVLFTVAESHTRRVKRNLHEHREGPKHQHERLPWGLPLPGSRSSAGTPQPGHSQSSLAPPCPVDSARVGRCLTKTRLNS